MALFDKIKEAKANADAKANEREAERQAKREQIEQALKECPGVDIILNEIVNSGKFWVNNSRNYYDHNERLIVISKDSVQIRIFDEVEEIEVSEAFPNGYKHKVRRKTDDLYFTFTEFGFQPLHEVDGFHEFTIIDMFTEIFKDKFNEKTGHDVDKYIDRKMDDNSCNFKYYVKKREYKDWF